MKLYKILILGAAAWAGVIYYNRFYALKESFGSSRSSGFQDSMMSGTSVGGIGGIGGAGVESGASSSGGIMGRSDNNSAPLGGSTGSGFSSRPSAPAQDPKKTLKLMQASAKGDLETVKELIEDKIKVNEHDNQRRTALMYASWNGQNEICARLLAAGASAAYEDKNGNNAYDYAASRGLVDTVKFMLSETGGADKGHYLEYAAIIGAVTAGNPALLPAGKGKLASVNRFNPEDQSPMHLVAGNGSIAVADVLLKRGASINLDTHEGQTPLHWAAWNNQPQMIEWLLKNGAEGSPVDAAGNTPLMLAAQNNNIDAAKVLLARGARRNLANKEGKTARMIAEDKSYNELASLFK